MRYDWTVEVAGDDISQWVKAGGTIDYGKPSRFTGFQAPIAVFEVFTRDENPNPAPAPGTWPVIRLGDTVIIHVTYTGTDQNRRFSGVVQALDYSLYGLRVTAAGALIDGPNAPTTGPYMAAADWQTRIAGTVGNIYPISTQTETERVEWLVSEAGYTVEVEGVPARRILGIPKNTPGQPLLDAVLRVADDCDALLLMDRLGQMRYRTKNFTRPTRWTIPAHLVDATSLDLALERGTVVNQVTVFYGEPDPDTGLQLAVSDQDSTSIGDLGERRQEIYTDLAFQQGAYGRAGDFLVKNQAAWELPDVALVMNQATGPEADQVLDLQENWRVRVSPLPAGCPIPEYDGDILGITEVMHETDYRVILHLAPPFGTETDIPEEPVFDQDSIVGGTRSVYEDQFGHLWEVHVWDTAGASTFQVVKGVTTECLVIAGGGAGGGGSLSKEGGGGGAGAVFAHELDFTPGTVAVTVGAGGVGVPSGTGGNGGDTRVADLIVYGGGGGGDGNNTGFGSPGQAGGFGGGGGGDAGPGGAGRWGSLDGGATTNTSLILGGPGGGSSGAVSFPGGGASLPNAITGTTVVYAQGGPSGEPGSPAGATTPGSGGRGGGNNGGTGANGRPGFVALRYRIG